VLLEHHGLSLAVFVRALDLRGEAAAFGGVAILDPADPALEVGQQVAERR
jgi:hypothetical protein